MGYQEVLDEQSALQEERLLAQTAIELDDARWLLKSDRFRRFIYNQFNVGYLPFDPMTDDARRSAYIMGLQAACAQLCTLLSTADTKLYHKMMAEGALEKESKNG
jgi:hypothetical protein